MMIPSIYFLMMNLEYIEIKKQAIRSLDFIII